MVKVFNTLTRNLEDFKEITPGQAGVYSCGPTVYQIAHIGNLRSYIFADVLRRMLEFNGYAVKQIVNITDVGHLTSDADTGEDKVEQSAKRSGESARQIADQVEAQFKEDLKKLNILTPSVMPKATEHIGEMIDLIETLEKKGFTYPTSTGIYFDTSKLKDYGKLARLNLSGQRAGTRVEEDPEKKHPYDFALWKFSPKDSKRQMEWSSPWGVGFPGWHIECSVMSVKYLGQPFDIHTGGIDHIPTHHTNEIAQTEAATGKPLSNYFMHGEFLVWNEGKMSKSQGNITTLSELEEKGYDPLAYRYLTLTAHYRSQLNFSFESLDAAQTALRSLREEVSSYPTPGQVNSEFEARFKEKINNDLDMPGALAITWELVKSDLPADIKAATLFKFDEVLGLNLSESRQELEKNEDELLHNYVNARMKKDYKSSDEIRNLLRDKHQIEVEDTEENGRVGVKWFKKER